MVILNPVPGQEERNADHLLEWGVAIRLNSPESVGWRISELLRDRARLKRMRTAALARATPLASSTIVESLRAACDRAAPFTPRLAGMPSASLEQSRGDLVKSQQ
jgi:processive 1,2-diacylglycerol beta-glucosyltransferase